MSHGGNVWISGEPSEWLDFSANLRPEGPPPWVLEAFHSAAETLRFYPDPEMKRTRKGLASFLGVPEEYVGIGNCILGYRAGDLPEAAKRKSGRIVYA